ncbi:MAG: hypothetical protein EZS28_023665 [Streblomastix strix]|uniref:Protein kinase domain-containing protein n=1 Tax=Streblomastix strix TaxID=222440 RepID=A0A5J4VE07_9EUKA|nr:MAG: hypothetical protein EZS28_023665 [Streblomastix strix]
MSIIPVRIGELIGKKYVTEKVIYIGKNLAVFLAKWKDNVPSVTLTLKFELNYSDQTSLINEKNVTKKIKDSNHFAKVIEFGKHREFNFLAVELLGPNLSFLAHRRPPYKLSLQTLLQFVYQALNALQTLHQAGFVHGAIEAV